MKIYAGKKLVSNISEIKGVKPNLPVNKPPANVTVKPQTNTGKLPFFKRVTAFIKENLYLAKYKFLNYLYTDEPVMLNARNTINKPARTLIAQYIKPALRKMIKGKVDPAELDRRLTKLAGKENVVEEYFRPAPQTGITKGRKKIYYLKSGSVLELECHDYTKGNEVRYVTRLSDTSKNRDRRSYMNIDGDLMVDTYKKFCTHLDAGDYGPSWINQKRKIK